MTKGRVFPELLAGREDDAVLGPWTVREGSSMRGAASCNLADRVLEVPLGNGAVERVVRAHELMHARVSPQIHHLERALDEVFPRALECAEELRVNVLLARLGFDTGLLRDGTEKLGGRRLGEHALWPEAVCFFMAVLGTGAEKDFLSGIRQGCPAWLPALRAVAKRAHVIFAQSTTMVASTRLNVDGLPSGYSATTLVLARTLSQVMEARPPTGTEQLRAFRRSLEVGGRRPATGRFADLVVATPQGRLARSGPAPTRRARAATTGTVLRFPGRLLTDDHRRAFAQRVRCRGGVVILDQSGSMDLDEDCLRALLREVPHALVVGYSHRPGDRGATPNVWLLCDRGLVTTPSPIGNVGNGVDGPAVRFALARRQGSEPVVWITDGQVTDSHDHPDLELTRECAVLVRRHGIRLARDVAEATSVLRYGGPTPRSRLTIFGRLGRCLLEIGEIRA